MKYVYLFLPAIGWGLMPLVIASVKNSTVYNQIIVNSVVNPKACPNL